MMMRSLSESPERTHEAVLLFLKKQGNMSVAELCDALKVTSMAVRRHLVGLQNQGLVSSKIVRQVRGRPTYRYSLTEKAERLFPSGFENLATDLVDTVFEVGGHKGVMDLLSLRNERQVRKFRLRMEDKDLEGKVAEVAKIFAENGYMSDWQPLPDGNFLIFQRHCAVHDLANKYRQLCVLEPRLIERLIGTKVTRSQYMLKNDPVCAYLIHNQI